MNFLDNKNKSNSLKTKEFLITSKEIFSKDDIQEISLNDFRFNRANDRDLRFNVNFCLYSGSITSKLDFYLNLKVSISEDRLKHEIYLILLNTIRNIKEEEPFEKTFKNNILEKYNK